jgi:hypothetical protein
VQNLSEFVAVIPLDDRTVIPAMNRGVTCMMDNKLQPAARGIYTLAEALRARFIKQDADSPDNTAKR